MEVWLVVLWILATFIVGSVAGLLGKRYGAEYPIALVASLVVMANIFANKAPYKIKKQIEAESMSVWRYEHLKGFCSGIEKVLIAIAHRLRDLSSERIASNNQQG